MENKQTKKIKVGFLTERMLLGFGVDRVVDKTAEELIALGFDVAVFCIMNDGTYSNRNYKLVDIRVPLKKNPIATELETIKALKKLDSEDIDIWIAETYPFFIAPLVLKKPVIVVDHGVCSTEGFDWKKKLVFEYMKFTQNFFYFPRAAKVVNISKFTQSLTPKLLRNNQSVVYNGADNYEYPSENEIIEFRKKYEISTDDVALLYVGRINHKKQPYKGTRELVESFKHIKKKHPNAKLIMAGFGDENDKEWLKSEGIMPFISADDKTLSLIYSICNIYITASKWEGFNLPLVEAAHFGVPYVAYDIGAHGEVVDNLSGFLVKNKKEFILKIEQLIFDKKKRSLMAQNAKRNASRFLWSGAGINYRDLILEVLSLPKKTIFKNIVKKKYDDGIVDVITLNYNGKKYLEPLFTSLKNQSYDKIKVTMVDNGSNDGSAEYVIEKFPWVNLIKSKKNLFFSRGNNLAVSKTNGEYIFFVNNDTVLESAAIQNMVNVVIKKGKYNIASVAAKMLFYKDKKLIDSAGVVITGNGSPFNRGIGQIDIGQYDKEEEIFGACFGAVLIRRNIYENAVGPLDNSYFGYFEDVDWSYRARIFGYKSYFCPNAIVYHDHSGTSQKFGYEWKYYLIHRNFLKTVIKNFQFKKMVLKGGWKILELINQLRKKNNFERKKTVLKVFMHVVISLPGLLWKRCLIQRKRCVSDYECIKFSKDENAFFNPVAYTPLLTLDTLCAMFTRLDMIKKFRNSEVSGIVSKTLYLNGNKMLMEECLWDIETTRLLESLEKYIGKDYVKKFIDAVVINKIWKK
ncbi:MAG: glycosyltransferase [Parcubacteria group bacterium]